MKGLDESHYPTDHEPFVVFRIGQLYFDFACQIHMFQAPSNLTTEQKKKYEAILQQYTTGLMSKARRAFERATRQAVSPWSSKAQDIVSEIPANTKAIDSDVADEVCQTYRRIYASPAAIQRANNRLSADEVDVGRGSSPDDSPDTVPADRDEAGLRGIE